MPLSAGLQLDGSPQADFLNPYIVPLAAVILLGVFSIQSLVSSSVSRLFGPVMAAWFTVLALAGIVQIWHGPGVLAALDPRYALAYLAHAGAWPGFAVLASRPELEPASGSTRRRERSGLAPSRALSTARPGSRDQGPFIADQTRPSLLDRMFRGLGEAEIGDRLARTLGPAKLATILGRLELQDLRGTVQRWREGAVDQTVTAHPLTAAVGDLLREMANVFGFEPIELTDVLVNNLPAAVRHISSRRSAPHDG